MKKGERENKEKKSPLFDINEQSAFSLGFNTVHILPMYILIKRQIQVKCRHKE